MSKPVSKPVTPSPRTRPAKAALSREGIIAAAMKILQAEGLGKLSMRRLAATLDTGPASLYVYVRNTEDLHAQLLDGLLTAAPMGEGNWRARLHQVVLDYANVLFSHPDLAKMALTTPASGPNYLALVDAILGLLLQGGASEPAAAWGVDMILLLATGNAAEKASWQSGAGNNMNIETLATALQCADAKIYPHIARTAPHLMTGEGLERFHWGLDVLITGILAVP